MFMSRKRKKYEEDNNSLLSLKMPRKSPDRESESINPGTSSDIDFVPQATGSSFIKSCSDIHPASQVTESSLNGSGSNSQYRTQASESGLNGVKSPKEGLKNNETKNNENSTVNAEKIDISILNISQLLHIGEGPTTDQNEHGIVCACSSLANQGNIRYRPPSRAPVLAIEDSDSDSGSGSYLSEDEWIEVGDGGNPNHESASAAENVGNITVEVPVSKTSGKAKKGFDINAHLMKQINQTLRETQIFIHKVHILGWIAHLKYVNKILNSESLMTAASSLITSKNLYPPKYADINYLEKIMLWFHSAIELKEFLKNPVGKEDLSGQLLHNFNAKTAYKKKHFVLMFVATSRVLGLKTRLIMSFKVAPLKPQTIKCVRKTESKGNGNSAIGKNSDGKEDETKKVKNTGSHPENFEPAVASTSKAGGTVVTKRKSDSDALQEGSNKMIKTPKAVNPKAGSSGYENKRTTMFLEDSDSDEDMISKHFKNSSKITKKEQGPSSQNQPRPSTSKGKSYGKNSKGKALAKPIQNTNPNKEESSPSTSKGKSYGKNSKGKALAKPIETDKEKKKNMASNTADPEMKPKEIGTSNDSSDSDSDFVSKSLERNKRQNSIDRKVFSSDEEDEFRGKKEGMDVWIEVFLEAEEKWISVDIVKQKIHCINEILVQATHPVVYVIACNNDSTLKDITKKYVPNWHCDTRKKRVDDEWWDETMAPYVGPKTPQDLEEDEEIERQMLDMPLPGSISEYKNHPLYVLERHLLKFQALYPKRPSTLGFIRGEPVYPRHAVATLRSRESWFKEARVVKPDEEPYKIVTARPKYDKMTGEVRKDIPLELFGFWQTGSYKPPTAVDGIVPRNEYGNVYLFQQSMLPRGTVYLQIPGINKTAKKLGIDCAAAVTGFEFHSGSSHPILDGFVVCQELKDKLLDEWDKEMDEAYTKNRKKILRRVYRNWFRFARKLLLRQRLKEQYDFNFEYKDPKATTNDK